MTIRKEINKATVEIQAVDKVVGRVCPSYSHMCSGAK